MKTLAKTLMALLSVSMLACQNNETNNSDADIAKVTIKTIPGFSGMVDTLPKLTMPYNDDQLKTVQANAFIPAANGHKFQMIQAGVLFNRDTVTALIFKCYTDLNKNRYQVFLATFHKNGKTIASEEIGVNAVEENGNEHSNTSMQPVFDGDSLVQLRTQWYVYYTNRESSPKSKSKLKLIRIGRNGTITHIPQENVSFQDFMNRFPALKLPLALTIAPDNSLLKPVSLLTPYYNFEGYMLADTLQFYHFGRISLPGKYPMLVYTTGQMEQGEGITEPGYQLVVYSPEGKETDRHMLLGTEAAESYYTTAENATIDASGNIHLTETLGEPVYYTVNLSDDLRYIWDLSLKPDNEGKLDQTRNSLQIASNFYDPATLKANLKEILSGEEEHEEHYFNGVSWIPFEKPVAIGLHIFRRNNEVLAEVFLGNENMDVTDRFIVYNGLKRTIYAGTMPAQFEDQDDAISAQGEKIEFNGPVTLKVAGKLLEVTPQGKFKVK
ncbi:hypothetical protein [Chitinophaga sp. Cy-1792]|uniref:hypothetical protein n=1 Tax=Chitinophaga sp. Cy-1792 TaxID=2608339 RepID=UPI001422BBF0|nr:hypothetical protein [Chitinophaga sp. Cy-1792]NIG56064.1 hypothetical protein [Chitinophaga sp. Cy-1792]